MNHTTRKKLLIGAALANGNLSSPLAFGVVPMGSEHQAHMQTLIAKAEGRLMPASSVKQ